MIYFHFGAMEKGDHEIHINSPTIIGLRCYFSFFNMQISLENFVSFLMIFVIILTQLAKMHL